MVVREESPPPFCIFIQVTEYLCIRMIFCQQVYHSQYFFLVRKIIFTKVTPDICTHTCPSLYCLKINIIVLTVNYLQPSSRSKT